MGDLGDFLGGGAQAMLEMRSFHGEPHIVDFSDAVDGDLGGSWKRGDV